MTPPIVQAAFWMIGSIVSFSFMAVAGRWLSDGYDTFEIMLYRSLVGVVIVVSVSSYFGTIRQVTTKAAPHHILRNFFHFIGQNLWFFALTLIPLAQVFALEFTAPLWVLLLAPVLLGEKMTRSRVIAGCLGFIGILLVTRPGASPISIGVIAGAGAALCFAITNILTKRLTRTQSLTTILMYLTCIQAIFGLICAGWDGDIELPTRSSGPLLALVGVAGLVAHLCLTKALSIAPASAVAPFDFTRLPLIAVVGMVLFNEPIDLWIIAGAVLIFAGNYYNILNETRKPQVSD